jgi:hypothetical protein
LTFFGINIAVISSYKQPESYSFDSFVSGLTSGAASPDAGASVTGASTTGARPSDFQDGATGADNGGMIGEIAGFWKSVGGG